LATLFTSITTAIGFASLYFTGIPALQDFGLITAAGVLAAFLIAISMLPAWLVLSKEPAKSIQHTSNWHKKLGVLFAPIIRYKRWIFIGTIVLAGLLTFASSKLELNNFLLEDLKPSEPLRKDFAFFDNYFSGARPFELGIKLKPGEGGTLLDRKYINVIAQIEEHLKSEYDVSAMQSPLTVVRELNRMSHGGRNEYYKIPNEDREWKKMSKRLDKIAKTGKLKPVIAEGLNYARITGRSGDLGAQAFAAKNKKFRNFVTENKLEKDLKLEITGTGTLIDRTNQNLVFSLAKGLGIAFLLISILMGFLFKSFKMVLIALVPNLLPLVAVGAVMALLNIDLKMSTSIIFTIAFGIAVDDTIHLLSRYRLELRRGKSQLRSLKNAYVHTGKALIITSVILFGGFVSLCFSSFQSTYYIGLLVTLTLLFALVFDLSVLPALVSTVKPKKKINNRG
jgi:predicted RND superfamily exporter protein